MHGVMPGVCMRECLGYAWGMHGVCLGYARGMPEVCPGYAWGICLGYARVCLGYAWGLGQTTCITKLIHWYDDNKTRSSLKLVQNIGFKLEILHTTVTHQNLYCNQCCYTNALKDVVVYPIVGFKRY